MFGSLAAQKLESRKKIILWDLGYTLVEPSKRKMFSYIIPTAYGFNPWNIVRLTSLYFNGCLTSENMQKCMYSILNRARPNEKLQQRVLDQNESPLPNIYCDHLSSAKSDEDIFAEIQEAIRSIERADAGKAKFNDLFFKNPMHKYLLEATLRLLFAEPKYYAECFYPIAGVVELVRECAFAGHEMAILSNFKSSSFAYLIAYKPNQEIFRYFKSENIFISGTTHLLKPYEQAYSYVVEKMGATPEEFIFIDDQIKNLEVASSIGMKTIHVSDYKNPETYRNIRQELIRLGALVN